MTVPLEWVGWVLILIVALVGVAVLRGVRRARRGGFGVADEERRLRDDPRFAEDWVRQVRPPDAPGGTDDGGDDGPRG